MIKGLVAASFTLFFVVGPALIAYRSCVVPHSDSEAHRDRQPDEVTVEPEKTADEATIDQEGHIGMERPPSTVAPSEDVGTTTNHAEKDGSRRTETSISDRAAGLAAQWDIPGRIVGINKARLPGQYLHKATTGHLMEIHRSLQGIEQEPLRTVAFADALQRLDYLVAKATDDEILQLVCVLRRGVADVLREMRPVHPALGSYVQEHFVEVPGGEFRRDDTKFSSYSSPSYTVRLGSFQLQAHEVRNEEFRWFDPAHEGREGYPAMVSGAAAYTFAAWVGGRASNGRLPTTAEWEFAAAGNCPSDDGWCSSDGRSADLDDLAWHSRNSGGVIHKSMEQDAFGQVIKKPNQHGLYDIWGNVWERVADAQGEIHWGWSSLQVDPWSEPTGKLHRSLRMHGGAFDRGPYVPSHTHYERWSPHMPEYREWIGFRVMLPSKQREGSRCLAPTSQASSERHPQTLETADLVSESDAIDGHEIGGELRPKTVDRALP